jgi:hypothetical protein
VTHQFICQSATADVSNWFRPPRPSEIISLAGIDFEIRELAPSAALHGAASSLMIFLSITANVSGHADLGTAESAIIFFALADAA